MSFLLKRKDVLLTITILSFALVTVPYFVQIPELDTSSQKLVVIVSVVNAMAVILALYSQTRRSILFVRQRLHGWAYQIYLIVAVYLMAFLGLALGQTSDPYRWFQYGIYMPCQSVIYSIWPSTWPPHVQELSEQEAHKLFCSLLSA